MPAVRGYTLELYCDLENSNHDYFEFPHEYVGEHGSKLRNEARKDGWIIGRYSKAICPKCSGKERTPNDQR